MATQWQQNYQIYKRYVRNLALMYQKRQDLKIFTELLLSLSVIIIFGLFAIRPTLVTIVGLNKDIDAKKDVIAQLDDKIEVIISAQALYDSNLEAISIINQAIPQRPDPVIFSRQIEGLARRHNLEISGLNSEDVPLIGGVTEVAPPEGVVDQTATIDTFPADAKGYTFEISLNGDYQSMNTFLSEFENMRLVMFQDSLTMQITQVEGQEDGLLLHIAGRLAYLPNEQ